MVSFSCEACGDVLTKKKLDPHRNRCYGASFTCIDCMVHFQGSQYKSHTSCITEAKKYQGALYKDKTNHNNNNNDHRHHHHHSNKKVKLADTVTPATCAPPVFSNSKHHTTTSNSNDSKMASHRAFVEDLPDEPYDVNLFLQSEEQTPCIPPPAPSPPSARPIKENVNVFDYMVGQSTPNMSNLDATRGSSPTPPPETNEIVRYDFEANGLIDPEGTLDMDGRVPLVPKNESRIPPLQLKTPAAHTHRMSKDKKRKRLHIDTQSPPRESSTGDEEMVDAPPVLHSGLTGGLNRLNVFPPSPDYSGSGGDGNELSPTGPIKKKKAQKATKEKAKPSKNRTRADSGGFLNKLLPSTSVNKPRKRAASGSSTKPPKPKKASTHRHRRHSSHHHHTSPKLIEYKSTDAKDEEKKGSTAMVVYRPRADLFMSFVNKGPESERGCSLNKALKRFHRERAETEDALPKGKEEKELFKTLRLKRNDRGEIVLFSIPDELAELL